jgi:hypothetical protein
MKLLVPLFVFSVLVSSALACVGDSDAELEARYGKQVQTGTSKLPGVTIRGYKFRGFSVVVGVINGHSAFEMYSKKDHSKLNANEVGALMTANSGGGTWNAVEDAAYEGKKWALSDGTVTVEWPNMGGELTVMTKAGADLMQATPTKPATPPAPAKK